jgi:hypothetical protein
MKDAFGDFAKGKPLLRVHCGMDRIARHVDAFNEIAYEFRC